MYIKGGTTTNSKIFSIVDEAITKTEKSSRGNRVVVKAKAIRYYAQIRHSGEGDSGRSAGFTCSF